MGLSFSLLHLLGRLKRSSIPYIPSSHDFIVEQAYVLLVARELAPQRPLRVVNLILEIQTVPIPGGGVARN